MKEQKKENGILKENEQMNGQPVALSDEMLEQVSGGAVRMKPLTGCDKGHESYCGKASPCSYCPYV